MNFKAPRGYGNKLRGLWGPGSESKSESISNDDGLKGNISSRFSFRLVIINGPVRLRMETMVEKRPMGRRGHTVNHSAFDRFPFQISHELGG
jgi:hypothetical protein